MVVCSYNKCNIYHRITSVAIVADKSRLCRALLFISSRTTPSTQITSVTLREVTNHRSNEIVVHIVV